MSGSPGILKRFSWLLLADVFARLLGFLATTHIAHALTVSGFGVIGYGLSLAGFFLLIVDGGVAVVGSMEVSRRADRHSALVAHFLYAKFLFACACFPIFLIVCFLATSQSDFRIALFLSGLVIWTSCLRLDWFFVGVGATHVPAIGTFISQTLYMAGVYLLVQSEADLVRVPLVAVLAEILAALFIGWQFAQRVGFKGLKIEPPQLGETFKNCWRLVSMQLLRHVSFTFDTIFIGFVLSLRAVGVYLAIYKVILMVVGIGGVYLQNLLPVMARQIHIEPEASGQLLERSLFWTAMIVLPCATGIAMTSGPLISFLFGQNYTAGRLPLQILSLSAVFVVLNGNFRQTLIAADLQPLVLRLAATTAAVNIVLNVGLILPFGIEGAAIAAMLAELLFLVITYAAVRRTAIQASFWRPVLPPAILSLLMAAIVMPLTHGHLWSTVFAGAAVYGVLFLLVSSNQTGRAFLVQDVVGDAWRWLENSRDARANRVP